MTVQWQSFYHRAIEELCQNNAEFVRLVLQVAIYKNPDERGKQAEEKLDILLKTWF